MTRLYDWMMTRLGCCGCGCGLGFVVLGAMTAGTGWVGWQVIS